MLQGLIWGLHILLLGTFLGLLTTHIGFELVAQYLVLVTKIGSRRNKSKVKKKFIKSRNSKKICKVIIF